MNQLSHVTVEHQPQRHPVDVTIRPDQRHRHGLRYRFGCGERRWASSARAARPGSCLEVLEAFITEYTAHANGIRFYNRGIPDGYG